MVPGGLANQAYAFQSSMRGNTVACATADICKCFIFAICKIILQANQDNALCSQCVPAEVKYLLLMSKR